MEYAKHQKTPTHMDALPTVWTEIDKSWLQFILPTNGHLVSAQPNFGQLVTYWSALG